MTELNFININKTGLIVGFSGAHRTGKTTICRTINNANPYCKFLESNVSGIVKEKFGLDVNAPADTKTFLEMQNFIIDHLESVWREHNYLCITDRTPLDIMAYTAAKMNYSDYFDKELCNLYENVIIKCKKCLTKYFGCIIHVQPGITYVETEGKPSISKPYQDIIDKLCIGNGLTHFPEFNILPKDMLEIEERMEEVTAIINDFRDNIKSLIKDKVKQ